MKHNTFRPLTTIFLFLTTSAMSQAAEISPNAKTWLHSLKTPSGTFTELTKFPNLPTGYREKVPGYFSSRALRDLELGFGPVLAGGPCVPQTLVEFLTQLGPEPSEDPAVREFESQVVHIQVLACFGGVTAKQVAAAFSSSEFKARGADTVVSSQKTGARVCQTTQVQVMGTSNYCYSEVQLNAPEAIYIHSFNDWNQPGVQAPVYIREILTAVSDARINGQPGSAFFTDVYIRSVKISGFLKKFARPTIQKGQENSMALLHAIAREGGTND